MFSKSISSSVVVPAKAILSMRRSPIGAAFGSMLLLGLSKNGTKNGFQSTSMTGIVCSTNFLVRWLIF